MAQLNITLNQDEILQLLSHNHDEALRKLLTDSVNAILNAESAAQLGAEPYERTAERTDSRNGYRERTLKTRMFHDIATYHSEPLYLKITPEVRLLSLHQWLKWSLMVSQLERSAR